MKYFYWITVFILAAALVFFVFVPAFAGKLSIPPQIPLGSFGIRLYGICIALGVLAAYLVARRHSWRFGVSPTGVDDLAFWITIVGVVGARIYYVVFNWKFYASDLTEIYKIWHGGISIYGAIIAGAIFVLLYSRSKAYSVYQIFDLVALSLPLGQAVGRFGNFFNQEAFGAPTNLPWKMYVAAINRPTQYSQNAFFHPTFLYEAVLNVAIYFVLAKFLLGKVRPGILAFTYLGLYSVGRFFIEGIRLDSSYLLGFKLDQLTAVLGVLVAGVMVIWINRDAYVPALKK